MIPHLDPAPMLFLLLVAHALADYPLQGEFLAAGKNRRTDIGRLFWVWCLPAHALIHGGFVFAITGSLALGVAETAAHGVTDWLKCEGRIGLHADQTIHVVCKVGWVALIAVGS